MAERVIFGLFTVGGLIFVYLVLNQGGGKPAATVIGAGANAGGTLISKLQGR